MDIDTKVVIVTGASSGIGLATAKLLTAAGAKVALVARSTGKLSQLSAELAESFARPTDMTEPDGIVQMVQDVLDHYGRIDVLINCAGQGYDASIEKTNIETMQDIFDLDVVGPPSDQDETVVEEAEDADYQPPPPDSAEFVARKIVDCIRTRDAEVYAHDWMQPPGWTVPARE